MSNETPDAEGVNPEQPDSIDHLDFEPEGVEEQSQEAPIQTELEKAQADAASHLADLQRLNAEYVNFSKRAKREQEAARGRGVEDVLNSLLPVLDDITRADQAGELTGPFQAISEKLNGVLGKYGVESFGAVGEEFDPNLHEALMHQTSADATSTTITHLIEVGYKIGDRVVRAARVAVTGPED
ncbi:nucleotide exchange factor GrpE [Timonella senegalensis]|uniref:nucleotide exchange factor GrpE n=1 Tax=Timonella senegalensis TaxID=1465825 RepID=UPI0002E894B2|nr:nucleotide exchange factor GrpE [Timonella senegalensis]